MSPAAPLSPSALGLNLTPAEGTAGTGPNVATGRLDNGLEIVVIPDHRAPVVTHMIWYRNGSADDPVGKSGIAHFLEHLMFKGTATHPRGQFSEAVAELGGQENAFTSNDYTAYFQRIAKEHLGTLMGFEADRMTNLVLSDEVVDPERDVVLEERRMRTDTDPVAAAVRGRPGGSVLVPSLRQADHRLEARDRDARSRRRPRPITAASTRRRTPS